MKKKSILPVSRGEFRAIAVTSLVICLSVVLPPHLVPLIQSREAPIVQITKLNNEELRSEELHNEGASDLIFTSTSVTANSPVYRNRDYGNSENKDNPNADRLTAGTQNPGALTSGAQDPDKWNSSRQTSDANYSGVQNTGKQTTGKRGTGARFSNTGSSDMRKRTYKSQKIHCKSFDPNEIEGDTLVAWGMRSYIVRNMINYRRSGGKFRKSADLARIYGMDSLTFIQIADCIDIPKAIIQAVYINKADTSQWMALPGIGRVLSKRIIKFREKLGGFYRIEQVQSTYGLPQETYVRIQPYLRIKSRPSPIDLSTATVDQLASHPNISLKQAQVMINYFDQHGRPQTLDELNNLYIADSTWLALITPYLIISASASK